MKKVNTGAFFSISHNIIAGGCPGEIDGWGIQDQLVKIPFSHNTEFIHRETVMATVFDSFKKY